MNSPIGQRSAGLLLPAFTPRRRADLGIGDTRAMRDWIDWAADHNVGFLQLLPINETGSDDSPYNAISSIALDPVYLSFDPGEIPGITGEDLAAARENLGAALESERVDYPLVRRVKRGLLDLSWSRFPMADPALHEEFAHFRRDEAEWLEDYCAYRWLMEHNNGSEEWSAWAEDSDTPEKARALLSKHLATSPVRTGDRLAFFAFVQWLCFRQWRTVRSRADARGVKLMGDVPIGVSWNSADVFFGQEDFDLEWCGGAPPETMFKHDRFIQQWGQNWGIPLYRWDKMEAEGFPWWTRRIRKLTEIFNIFRIDHILGFYRIYAFPWRPSRNAEFIDLTEEEAAELTGGPLPQWAWRSDEEAEDREANLADGDRRLRAILAAAGDSAVVGEDLGCLPDYVRPHLETLGIAGFRVPHWDVNEHDHVIPGKLLPECSFATYATHDHDSISAMWTGWCRAVNHHHGHLTHTDEAAAAMEAGRNLRLLGEFSGIPQHPTGLWPKYSETLQWRLIKALLDTNSRYAALMITDLFSMDQRVNRPGTVSPENWSLRLPYTLSDIRSEPKLNASATKLATLIGVTRRC